MDLEIPNMWSFWTRTHRSCDTRHAHSTFWP